MKHLAGGRERRYPVTLTSERGMRRSIPINERRHAARTRTRRRSRRPGSIVETRPRHAHDSAAGHAE